MGYSTGQFGKNHLGDLNKFLPTVHGFDEFFGGLYHLNAQEDPEDPDYPKGPRFAAAFGPRNLLKCRATDADDSTVGPRWGRVGKQNDRGRRAPRPQAHGNLRRRLRRRGQGLHHAPEQGGKPFFCWVNTTHMHFRTHTKPESLGQAGESQSPYHDTMIDHDKHVGELLDLIDQLGIAEDTFVMYPTDNGPHMNSWPDATTTPFRSEKDTNWEGAFRIPMLVRWPGKGPAGVVTNDIVQHHDWLPTLLAIAGERDIVEKCKKGHKAGDKTFKVHIDGYNLLPFLTEKGVKSPREAFLYFDDDGNAVAIRMNNWKFVFMEQRVEGTMRIWAEPLTVLRTPKMFNLCTDPYERADVTSNTYYDWFLSKGYRMFTAQAYVAKFLATFKDFPQRQKAASFTIDQAMEKMGSGGCGGVQAADVREGDV